MLMTKTASQGMFAHMLMPDLDDAELATPMMIMTLLPAGIAGFAIAAYIAAVMSTAGSCLIGPAAIFTNDIYNKRINPGARIYSSCASPLPRHYSWEPWRF
jgi:SSS family solute:Na+ symporter